MLLLIKRHKTTYLVEISLHESVQKLKSRISLIINKEKEAKELRLMYKPPKQTTYTVLEDAAVLEQVGVVDQDTLYLIYLNSDDGKWETVMVPPYEPLYEDADLADESAANKGKAPTTHSAT
ncbi:hypothetical protein QVD99_001784 [Batrachochytrium dendrobatidis]|nr:hypothetical protein O5D80_000427 [Batrachochytrium dendrobatidis]KAK5671962.1 hypothetical protein QVD99_001784 [Batrachochytrium dendrobatidis]